MTEAEFEALRIFLKARSGLALSPDKRYLVESRLSSVCTRFKIESLSHLVREIKTGRSIALEKATIEAMTTNETFFFRDKTPFDLFQDVLLPKYLKERASSRRLRIWCAAASSGQEPYSLAMLLKEAVRPNAGMAHRYRRIRHLHGGAGEGEGGSLQSVRGAARIADPASREVLHASRRPMADLA